MKEKFKISGRVLSKVEQKAIKGGGSVLLNCVWHDGIKFGTGDCFLCYSVCNTYGGISCTEGDCSTWTGGLSHE